MFNFANNSILKEFETEGDCNINFTGDIFNAEFP